MNIIKIDVKGKTCPIPVVEVRKALRNAKDGDIIEVIGTNELSKKEISMVVDAAEKEIDEIIDSGNEWKIIIKC